MNEKVLRFSPVSNEFSGLVAIDKITHLLKSQDGEITYIHLINGTVLESGDSINALEARINSED